MRGPVLGPLAVTRSLCLCLALVACRPANPTPKGAAAAAPELDRPDTAPATSPQRSALRVAITFDDLPAHGPLPEGVTHAEVHQRILEVLAAHDIQGVYGFVNGEKVTDDGVVLRAWRDAGQRLGNHTLRHVDVGKVGLEEFVADIDANDEVLAKMDAQEAERRIFRYPYLRPGPDEATLDGVRDHLTSRGYRIAEVTIDFGDWAYNPPYARCRNGGDDDSVEALRFDFLHRSTATLTWSEAAAQQIYGRSVPHVLLLHSGAFDAEVLDDLLTAYEKRGVEWIGLPEALADEAYQKLPRVPSKWGGTLLEQQIALGADHPPFPLQPLRLLERLCR